jgi:hypothetical protein
MGCGKGGGIAKTVSASQVVSRVLFFKNQFFDTKL